MGKPQRAQKTRRTTQIVTWKDARGRVRIARFDDNGECLNPEVLREVSNG